jgi:hypothetical protein
LIMEQSDHFVTYIAPNFHASRLTPHGFIQ